MKMTLLNYTLQIGKNNVQNPNPLPHQTVRGNVILLLPDYYFEKFNIPEFNLPKIPTKTIHSFNSERLYYDELKIVNISKHERCIKPTRKGKVATVKILTNSSPITANRKYEIKQYPFRFPIYFTTRHIDTALFSMFQFFPKREKCVFVLNNKEYFLSGTSTEWGSASVGTSLISDSVNQRWRKGQTSICYPPVDQVSNRIFF